MSRLLSATSPVMVMVLAALTALGPLATDIYLPAMPAMGEALDTGPDQVQLTLSIYMAGFALAQLVCGPLSDRFGRKPIMVIGIALFLVASLVCALSTRIELLWVGRFLQAFGGAVGPVLGRAAVRDIHGPTEAAKTLSYIASTMALAPAVAPLLGSGLLLLFGWQAVFFFLAAYAAIMLIVVVLLLPESLPAERRQSVHPSAILSNFRMLLGQRAFVGHTLTNAAGFSGLFAFLSGSSFVLIEFMQLSPPRYGLWFSMIVLGFFLGTLFSGRYSHRLGRERLLSLSTVLCLLGGGSMILLAFNEIFIPLAVIGPHMLYMAGFGILMPQTMGGALAPNPQCAGSASSLFGFIQMTVAAAAGAVVGQLHDGTSRTMALVIGVAGFAALLSYWLVARPADMQPVHRDASASAWK